MVTLRCVYSIYLLLKTLSNLLPLSLSSFFFPVFVFFFSCSIYLSDFLLTSFDLSFQISCCLQVACLSTARDHFLSAGGRIEFCITATEPEASYIFYFHIFHEHKLWMKWFKEMKKKQTVGKTSNMLAHSKACLLGTTGMRYMYLKWFPTKTIRNKSCEDPSKISIIVKWHTFVEKGDICYLLLLTAVASSGHGQKVSFLMKWSSIVKSMIYFSFHPNAASNPKQLH